MALFDTSDKIESLLQKSELGCTLRNIVPQLARRKFVKSQVERTSGNTNNNALNLQFGKINITRQVKCFFEWFASCLRNRKWRFPLLQVFHKETVIVLVSMT